MGRVGWDDGFAVVGLWWMGVVIALYVRGGLGGHGGEEDICL